jgi:TonB family protein
VSVFKSGRPTRADIAIVRPPANTRALPRDEFPWAPSAAVFLISSALVFACLNLTSASRQAFSKIVLAPTQSRASVDAQSPAPAAQTTVRRGLGEQASVVQPRPVQVVARQRKNRPRVEPQDDTADGQVQSPPPDVETMPGYAGPRALKMVLPDMAVLAPESLPLGGKIEVEADVDTFGHVTAARIPPGAPRISLEVARAAVKAVRQWNFEPATLRGTSVASRHTVVFEINTR